MFGIDPLYIAMILPVLLFSMWASVKVKSSFSKYSKIPASSGMTGKDTAEYILRANGLAHVKVVKSSGFL
ncbi:MAG TPA: zinc metallopeptidase, partial [Spirochaetota bacterium]|nr:zinc metallopeptidase [Spirochaetota bacterium]